MPRLEDHLHTHFGHPKFRPGQKAVIESLLADRSALAIFPTGGGKSICYQLPALLLDGLTIVVSPLLALMKDQVDRLRAKNHPAARLDSTLTQEEAQEVYQKLAAKELKLLYLAPERLQHPRLTEALRDQKISLLAIDEAHCISEWGHNFRPDYLTLPQFKERYQIPRVLALTATATPEVAADIRNQFQIPESEHHQTTFYRPNLHLFATALPDRDRLSYLATSLKKAPKNQAAIVYCTQQFDTERVAAYLNKAGLTARPYHAGLRPEVRTEIQTDFLAGKTPIICATIAFGMGIDKSDIRAIYHFQLPKSLEGYTQEIGRAGRDGQPATCELLACTADLPTLENFSYGDTPSETALRSLVRNLFALGSDFEISHYDLQTRYDIRPHVLATVLTYLELDGYLQPTSKSHSAYKLYLPTPFKPTPASFPEPTKSLLNYIVTEREPHRRTFQLDLDEATQALDLSSSDLRQALTTLIDAREFTAVPRKAQQRYHQLRSPENLSDLLNTLTERFQARENYDLLRLDEVKNYLLSPRCRYQHLLTYFGEEISPCGTCDTCRGDAPPAHFEPDAAPEIHPDDLELVQTLARERHAPLRSARALAKFLCGLRSPAANNFWYRPEKKARKQRLTSHGAFALLQPHPFPQVLALCQGLT